MEDLKSLYEKYLELPLATITKPSVIYDRGFVAKVDGLPAFFAPYPHRHFTYEEFVNEYNNIDQRLKRFIS